MDWCLESSIEDFVLPNDEELFDRLPSPESWSKWGVSTPEGSVTSNRCFLVDSYWNEEAFSCNSQIPTNEVDMECSINLKDQFRGSTISRRLSEESIHHSVLSGNQLDGLEGIEEMNDFFLFSGSLLENLSGSYQKPVKFSPKSQKGMGSMESLVEESVSDSQNISQTTGSSQYLNTNAFASSLGGVNAASQVFSCDTPQSDCSRVKVSRDKISVLLQHSCTGSVQGEETFIEEIVLQELKMVLTQLTNNTRICFRDALCRLANNSGEREVIHHRTADVPSWTDEDGKSRSRRNKPMEVESNTIDRAVANLMFNKMELNMQVSPVSAPTISKQGTEIGSSDIIV